MRSVSIDELKVKFIFDQTLNNKLDIIGESFLVCRMTESSIFFKRKLLKDSYETLNSFKIYFHVSGKWKCYPIENFSSCDNNGANANDERMVSGIVFDVQLSLQDEFYRDFTLARALSKKI